MTSVIWLLAILSGTFILSQMNIIRRIQGLLIVPIVIFAGYMFGPNGLFSFEESFTYPLETSARVILVWLGFLTGLRVLAKDQQYQWRHQGLRRLLYIVVSTAAIYLSLDWVLSGYFEFSSTTSLGVSLCLASLFATSSYFSQRGLELDESLSFLSYADSIFLALSFFVGSILFLPMEERLVFFGLNLIIPLVVGFVAVFLFGKKKELETPDRLALGGIVTLAAGWTVGVAGLEVIIGFLLGAIVSSFRLFPRFDPRLLATEVPLRLVLYFYAGLVLSLTWEAFFVATILTVFRFFAKWWLVRKHAKREERLSSVYRISSLSIPLVLSLHLSDHGFAVAPFLLSVLCFSYLINDVLLIFEQALFRPEEPDQIQPKEAHL